MLSAQGLYNHSTTTLEEEEAALFGMAWSLLSSGKLTKSVNHVFVYIQIAKSTYQRKICQNSYLVL